MSYQKKWWFNDVKFLLKHSNINIPSLTKKIWTRSYFFSFSSLKIKGFADDLVARALKYIITYQNEWENKIPLYCTTWYHMGRHFCGKKFLRNLFLRMKAPKTAHFAEFIFANATKLLKFAEFIFANATKLLKFAEFIFANPTFTLIFTG